LDENLECENGQNSFSYVHEVEDIPCQNLESNDPSFDDIERVNLEEIVEFPSSHEGEGQLLHESIQED
jgi:hypothetical protein